MNKELVKRAKTISPCMNIGKNGLTDNVIQEIKIHLKKNKLIKVKLLKSFADENNKKEVANIIADKTHSHLINIVGNSIALWKG